MSKQVVYALLFLLTFVLVTVVISAAEKSYSYGSVWGVTFVRTKTGMGEDYLKNLAANWKKVNDEAIKEGLILSYKILWGEPSDRDDWDMMLMVEYKNYAALDAPPEKWEAISAKIIGTEDVQKSGNVTRGEIREIFGGKTMQEIILK